MQNENKPLTTGEIAQYCHVTYRCVLKWIEAGKLKTFRTPGGHNRINPQVFFNFLKTYRMPIPFEFERELKQKRILIVDDDKNMVSSIRRILKAENGSFNIDVAYDGFDAGRKVVEFKPDLVILDIRMAGIDGYGVTKRIKKIVKLSLTKIIAISAFFDNGSRRKIISLGADMCLDKPFDREELLEKINGLIF